MKIREQKRKKKKTGEKKKKQRKGRITAGGGCPKWQRRLKPKRETSRRGESWPVGDGAEATAP